MNKIKTIGILTSGGDSPGMNAAIRAVTRAGIYNGFTIKGIYRGYDGLIKGEVKTLTTEDVSGIINRGGTILKTARSKEFMTLEGMQKAYETCQKEVIDALVVIGGNGSLTGARNFGMEFDFPVIGLPGTIDNDLYGTDATIGYDTTMNTIMECVDRIRDTANRGCHRTRGGDRRRPVGRIHEARHPQVKEVVHRHCERESQVRRPLLCRPCEEGIPRVRRTRINPWSSATWRHTIGPRPCAGINHRCRCYRGYHAGTAQRDGWRKKQRRGLCTLLGMYPHRQALRQASDYRA